MQTAQKTVKSQFKKFDKQFDIYTDPEPDSQEFQVGIVNAIDLVSKKTVYQWWGSDQERIAKGLERVASDFNKKYPDWVTEVDVIDDDHFIIMMRPHE